MGSKRKIKLRNFRIVALFLRKVLRKWLGSFTLLLTHLYGIFINKVERFLLILGNRYPFYIRIDDCF